MYPLVMVSVLVATLLQSVLGYHLGSQHLQSLSRRVLTVSVSDVDTDMDYDTDFSIDCVATGGMDTPYLSFFWLLSDDTSLPLSSNMPGVYIDTITKSNQKAAPTAGNRKQQQRPLANNSKVSIATLVLNRRFYEILRPGPNTFACHAYTFKGQQALQYFTINKLF